MAVSESPKDFSVSWMSQYILHGWVQTFFLGILPCAIGWSQSTLPPDTTRIVLLSSGKLLEGVVTRDATSFHIRYASGKITIPKERVACVARSKQEAYTFQRRNLAAADIEGHIQLADWCMDQRLLTCAETQLSTIRRLYGSQPNKSALRKLDKRLEFLHDIKERKAGGETKVGVGTARLVRHQEVVTAKADIPQTALAEFTRQVQPLLLNTCATANCHDRVQPGKMLLSRPFYGSAFNKRLTERNLAAVLEHVNFVDPKASPLLGTIARPHGSAPRAIFGADALDRQHARKLTSWIELVTGKSFVLQGPANGDAKRDDAFADIKPTAAEHALPSFAESNSSDPFDPGPFNESDRD